MNNKKALWVKLSLANLCIAALFGMSLRSKYLFPISFINYRNFISAHSHFAFGGWVTLALFTLYVYVFLPKELSRRKIYQWILWATELSALGMAFSFPFQGYALFSIFFSNTFILSTYAFAFVFWKESKKISLNKTSALLSKVALLCLVISSIGPYTLAYILATKSTDSILYRDAVYTFLHFQYNGFFTLSVFALFFHRFQPYTNPDHSRKIQRFGILISASIVPALFLSLLWHPENFIKVLGYTGCLLILGTLIVFFSFFKNLLRQIAFVTPIAKTFWLFAMISFILKMLLQTGTVIPSLGNAVFGYRPIIIGFLHLVFLGMVSFYILAEYIELGMIDVKKRLAKIGLVGFATAIILNETILMIQGIGLMFQSTSPIYSWLLWIISIFLFISSFLVAIGSASKSRWQKNSHGLYHD